MSSNAVLFRPAARSTYVVLATLTFAVVFKISFWTAFVDLINGRARASSYNAAVLGMDYFQFGAIHRGLVGSLYHFFPSSDLKFCGLILFVTCGLSFVGASCWLLSRLVVSPLVAAAFGVILVDTGITWSADIGRIDPLVGLVLALAAIAISRGKVGFASVVVAVGLLAHENAVIYGLPLIGALLADQGRFRSFERKQFLAAAAVILGSVLLYLAFDKLPHSDNQTIIRTLKAHLPSVEWVDYALYFTLSGSRGLKTTVCANMMHPFNVLHAVTGCFMILLCSVSLAGPRLGAWLCPFLAGSIPFLFLWAVASDGSRWITLSFTQVWLVSAIRSQPTAAVDGEMPWIRFALAPILVFLHAQSLFTLTNPIVVPSPFVDKIAQKLTKLDVPDIKTVFANCDPEWRDFLSR